MSKLNKYYVRYLFLCPGESNDGFLTPRGENQCQMSGQFFKLLGIEIPIAFMSSRLTDQASVISFCKGYDKILPAITLKGLAYNAYKFKKDILAYTDAFWEIIDCVGNRYRGESILFCSHEAKIITPLINFICKYPIDKPLPPRNKEALVIEVVYSLKELKKAIINYHELTYP